MELVQSNDIHVVAFQIIDHSAWRENLKQRNERDPEKNITEEIIRILNKNASSPSNQEGFATCMECMAIGEEGWERSFATAIEQIIRPLELQPVISLSSNNAP